VEHASLARTAAVIRRRCDRTHRESCSSTTAASSTLAPRACEVCDAGACTDLYTGMRLGVMTTSTASAGTVSRHSSRRPRDRSARSSLHTPCKHRRVTHRQHRQRREERSGTTSYPHSAGATQPHLVLPYRARTRRSFCTPVTPS
jgi:hypothetical protein